MTPRLRERRRSWSDEAYDRLAGYQRSWEDRADGDQGSPVRQSAAVEPVKSGAERAREAADQ